MTVTDEIARVAREAKGMLCASYPMAELWSPTVHVVTDRGRHVAMVLDASCLDHPVATAATIRAELAPETVGTAGVIVESYMHLGEDAPAFNLRDDYENNPASAVTPAVVLIVATANGAHAARFMPYRWDDHGVPAWGEHIDAPGELVAASVGAQVIALADAVAGVAL